MNQGTDQGLDLEKQIQEGVAAYQQSKDPAIAVQVVEMLAEVMGIAPEIDPYAQAPAQGQAIAPQEQIQPGAEMASHGMKIYRIGGKIKKFAKGSKVDPPSKDSKKRTIDKSLDWKDTPDNIQPELMTDIENRKAGSSHIFSRADFEAFEKGEMNPDNSFLDEGLLGGHRKRILEEFRNAPPELDQIYAYDWNLSLTPQMRINGKDYGQTGNGSQFSVASRGYKKPSEQPTPENNVPEIELDSITPDTTIPTIVPAPSVAPKPSGKISKYTAPKSGKGYRYKRGLPAKGSVTRRR